MEITFITLHDLSKDGRIRFASQAIEDILGFEPEEVINMPMWEFLHPDAVSLAMGQFEETRRHGLAAGLDYVILRHKNGHFVRCETVSTVVYDVLVSSTRVFRSGPKSEQRAADAPVVRNLFSLMNRPEHGLDSSILRAFSQGSSFAPREQRAALILNRFTRSSTIMHATSNISAVLGVTSAQLLSTSFYYCIEESCLQQAVQCIEGAKASDSVAYLRFWFRNPLQNDDPDFDQGAMSPRSEHSDYCSASEDGYESDESSSPGPSSPSFVPTRLASSSNMPARVEVEAVVSCASDGIVIVLRQATAPVPSLVQQSSHPVYMTCPYPSSGYNPATMRYARKPFPAQQLSSTGGPDPEVLKSSIREAALLGMRGQRCMS